MVFNLFDGPLETERAEPLGFRWSAARLGPLLGATKLGMSVYELEPGERSFPYHYEHGNEEWLLVVSGEPTLRAPDGEQRLRAGDVVCFPEGPAGAHQVRNDTDTRLRVAILSTKQSPGVAVYPDSDKLGVWDDDGFTMVRRSPQLDYWDGEL